MKHATAIDESNRLFHQYSVKRLPELIVIRDGKAVVRISDFSNPDAIGKTLHELK